MTDLLLPRRAILKAAASLIAFPAIVRAESLMKVKAIDGALFDEYGRSPMMDALPDVRKWRIYHQGKPLMNLWISDCEGRPVEAVVQSFIEAV